MEQLDNNNIPRHIAIIMDGNGRWAAERGKERSYGHQAGVETVRRITAECTKLGVEYLTLYTFSTENFRVIGDMARLPKEVQAKLEETMEHTANNSAMTMVVALSYSSRWEITDTMRHLAEEVKDGLLRPEDITEESISRRLATAFMPDPDLLIRTGGELRISNYLLWQIAYTELYFCDTYWPDFYEEDLHKAIASYQRRQRRFGKTEAQVESNQ